VPGIRVRPRDREARVRLPFDATHTMAGEA
jgi:hypothetical protein